MGSNPVMSLKISDIAPVSSKMFLDNQAAIKCGFTLKHVHDMIITYSQVKHCLQKDPRNPGYSLLLIIIDAGKIFLDENLVHFKTC